VFLKHSGEIITFCIMGQQVCLPGTLIFKKAQLN